MNKFVFCTLLILAGIKTAFAAILQNPSGIKVFTSPGMLAFLLFLSAFLAMVWAGWVKKTNN